MAKTSSLNIRIDPETKALAEKLFSSFGITITDAVNMFLYTSLMVGGLPFELKLQQYNSETESAIQEAKDIAVGKSKAKSFYSVSEIMEDLNNDTDN